MSLNTAHANDGVLLHNGECILLFCDNVTMEFHGQEQLDFLGQKKGRIYLTTHRMIFNAKDKKERMQSFSFPFVTLSDTELEQPMFGANYIKGKCCSQPNGNWTGECKYKLHFKSGGAVEFGQAMLRAAAMAQRNGPGYDAPPPYQPPSSNWYAAPPPAYQAAPQGYYGWMPPTHAFPASPPVNSVYMTDSPPPYPGINSAYVSGGNPQQQPQPGGGWGSAPPPPSAAQDNSWANPSYNGQPGLLADAKASEAAQSAYYDPNRPQCAYVPPPAYYESPPSFQQATGKKNQ
ncbi:hypothetical protein HCN44_002224 [Aphidius gifuensis]|uniref:GRAM domain-containing protein n=1 Tax=Aphidius gifuensis TaxID=684658 RepID=A0A834Y2M9_APHGI|nr:WW domain-binding protein 2 isoform X2 [Aphidius gifuensis]KAF7996578.1 hypothetical protein HCN44_002224 [Aphidius gifuensis]